MSKLSHNKAVARRRRQKHGHVKHYTKKEMKALMPGFKGQSLLSPDILRSMKRIEFEVDGTRIFIQLDKNNGICDCTRIGNIFCQLYGRVLSSELDVVERYHDVIQKVCN